MSTTVSGVADRSAVKEALLAITRLKARISTLEGQADEPIAVIGMGCHLPPDIRDPEALWALLAEGRQAIREVPAERWDADALFAPGAGTPGRSYSRHGGFLDEVAGFDDGFFGIGPREAAKLDPQARLLLQTCWRALEDALQPIERVRGSRTGLFMTTGEVDYARHTMASAAIGQIDGHCKTGANRAIGIGRIAYFLDTHGPVLHLDTSCSSSLVAAHLACASLRARECGMALVGGVNLLLAPEETVGFSALSALSPSGACHSFEASADGYVRGEGVAVLVLKRLDDALADGDPIRAVIMGSAVNHDGRSNGLTAPNPTMQQGVVQAAMARAGVSAAEIGYIEAHGTGTKLGDPIELGALARVFEGAQGPVFIGSLKANLGHLEPAAGAASLVKAVLMAQHGQIVPQPNFGAPNPLFDWQNAPFQVPVAVTDFPQGARAIGVSGFGMSGTNAHVVLQPGPAEQAIDGDGLAKGNPLILPVAARDGAALRDQVQRYEGMLADPACDDAALHGLCRAAATGRSHFSRRAAVVGFDRAALLVRLRAWLGSEPAQQADGVTREVILEVCEDTCGSTGEELAQALAQDPWRRMFEAWPPFRRELESLLPALADAGLAGPQPWFAAQPPMGGMVLQYALCLALRRLGVRFDAVTAGPGAQIIADLCTGKVALSEALDGLAGSPGATPRSAPTTPISRADSSLRIALGPSSGNALAPLAQDNPVHGIFEVLAACYCAGATVDWSDLVGRGAFGRLRPPMHPLALNRHWVDRPVTAGSLSASAIRLPDMVAEHIVAKRVIVPGAMLVSALFSQGQALLDTRDVVLGGIAFHAPLVPQSGARHMTLHKLGVVEGDTRLGLSLTGEGQSVGCSALVHRQGTVPDRALFTPPVLADLASGLNVGAHYDALLRLGLDLGPAFRTVAAIRAEAGEAVARLHCAVPLAGAAPADIDARLLDGAFQTAAALWSLAEREDDQAEGMLPISVETLRLHAPLTQDCVVVARARPHAADGADDHAADFDIFTPEGQPVLSVSGIRFHLTARASAAVQAGSDAAQGGRDAAALAGLPIEARQVGLQDYIRTVFAGSMGLKAAQIGLDDSLLGLGADSLAVQEFRWQLQDDFNLDIAVKPLLDAATVRAIAALIAPLIDAGAAAPPAIMEMVL